MEYTSVIERSHCIENRKIYHRKNRRGINGLGASFNIAMGIGIYKIVDASVDALLGLVLIKTGKGK